MTRTAAASGQRRWYDRLCHLLAACLRDLLVGLYYLSPVLDVQVAQALARRPPRPGGYPRNQPGRNTTEIALLQFPPPGHQETLATAVPLSAAEQELWACLTARRHRARLAGRR
jgi:hypothetical protein